MVLVAKGAQTQGGQDGGGSGEMHGLEKARRGARVEGDSTAAEMGYLGWKDRLDPTSEAFEQGMDTSTQCRRRNDGKRMDSATSTKMNDGQEARTETDDNDALRSKADDRRLLVGNALCDGGRQAMFTAKDRMRCGIAIMV